MKSFKISLLLFVLMSALILCNALYINKVAFRLSEGLEALPPLGDPACSDASRALSDEWKRRVPFVALSACDSLTERIDELLAILTSCTEQNDRYGFYQTLASLSNAIEELRRPETVSLRLF